MALYRYEALDADGKKVRGTTDAGTPVEARATLRGKGLETVRLDSAVVKAARQAAAQGQGPGQAQPAAQGGSDWRYWGGKRLDQLATFSRHLAMLLRTGLPLAQALSVLSEQFDDVRFREVIQDLAIRVREGSSLDQAMEAHPKYFPALLLCMTRAGAASGALAEVLSKVSAYYGRQKQLWDKLVSAVTYPILMSLVGLSVLIFLMAFVVPKVTGVLLEQKRVLPWPTEVLLAVSGFLQAWWWAVLIGVVLLALVLRGAMRSDAGRMLFDRMLLRIPFFGNLMRKQAVARWADTMSNLLASGIPVAEALTTVRGALGNLVLAKEVERMEQAILDGQDLSEALKISRHFPKSLGFVVAVGEEAGELPQVLDEVAKGYNEEVTVQSGRVADALTPVLIVFLGIVVGFIVAAILLPITDFSQVQ
jgi:type II secretory pathway component PulF